LDEVITAHFSLEVHPYTYAVVHVVILSKEYHSLVPRPSTLWRRVWEWD